MHIFGGPLGSNTIVSNQIIGSPTVGNTHHWQPHHCPCSHYPWSHCSWFHYPRPHRQSYPLSLKPLPAAPSSVIPLSAAPWLATRIVNDANVLRKILLQRHDCRQCPIIHGPIFRGPIIHCPIASNTHCHPWRPSWATHIVPSLIMDSRLFAQNRVVHKVLLNSYSNIWKNPSQNPDSVLTISI